jgi:DNA-binding NarL/FixJ family response regulator
VRRPRILIAEDHLIVADGLRRLLEPDFDVLEVVSNGRDLIRRSDQLRPDAILVDIGLPLMNGLEAARRIKKLELRAKIVFLTGNADIVVATEAIRLGAAGYVLKEAAADELLNAIREALNGGTYVTPRIATEVLDNLVRSEGKDQNGPLNLTNRERDVLQLLAEGRSYKEMAQLLKISPRTVEFHKENLMVKTGLRTTAELARYAARHGVVAD